MRYALISVLAMYLSGPALAEQTPVMSNDLTIGIGASGNALCPDAPPPPGWVSDLHPRQAWKGFHLLKIYQYLRDQEIIATGSCDCDTRFPAWAATEAEYEAHFASRSQAEQLSLLNDLSDARNAAKRAARAICRAGGRE